MAQIIAQQFLPTPSARRATALPSPTQSDAGFLPTPSARRATVPEGVMGPRLLISTHALREEGDRHQLFAEVEPVISTHALREEGDVCWQ